MILGGQSKRNCTLLNVLDTYSDLESRDDFYLNERDVLCCTGDEMCGTSLMILEEVRPDLIKRAFDIADARQSACVAAETLKRLIDTGAVH